MISFFIIYLCIFPSVFTYGDFLFTFFFGIFFWFNHFSHRTHTHTHTFLLHSFHIIFLHCLFFLFFCFEDFLGFLPINFPVCAVFVENYCFLHLIPIIFHFIFLFSSFSLSFDSIFHFISFYNEQILNIIKYYTEIHSWALVHC